MTEDDYDHMYSSIRGFLFVIILASDSNGDIRLIPVGLGSNRRTER